MQNGDSLCRKGAQSSSKTFTFYKVFGEKYKFPKLFFPAPRHLSHLIIHIHCSLKKELLINLKQKSSYSFSHPKPNHLFIDKKSIYYFFDLPRKVDTFSLRSDPDLVLALFFLSSFSFLSFFDFDT